MKGFTIIKTTNSKPSNIIAQEENNIIFCTIKSKYEIFEIILEL